MNRKRLSIYTGHTGHSRRRHGRFTGILTLVVIGIIIGGLFPLYERLASPPAEDPQPLNLVPLSLLPRPTLTPLALPTLAQPDAYSFLVPSAGIRAAVVEVFLNGVSWDVSRLGNNAGHLQGTAPFGAKGNLVLAGHVEMGDGRPGIFAHLDRMNTGDVLILSRGSASRRYAVREVKTVVPDDLTVLYPSSDERLTLITCDSYDFLQNLYRERIVVVADRSA